MSTQIGNPGGNQRIFNRTRTLPINEAFGYNFAAAQREANLRRTDLLVLTRRIVPRPLPTRDSARPYQTAVYNRKQYYSQRQSHMSQLIPRLEPHAVDTRRDKYHVMAV